MYRKKLRRKDHQVLRHENPEDKLQVCINRTYQEMRKNREQKKVGQYEHNDK